ncbi:MAG: cytochrome ubiquinol oxidase subunit I [Desulfovibrio sp.]|jgi:cytochrome d ubiquinol oxidase subunit I|nr:cytochrome ubiquinol oxidase subunit I [Desulfovibrio sp.]
MDAVMLSRLQFAVTVFFHFIFVPLTLGLSVLLAWMETRYVKTGDEIWKKHVKFWGKLFVINFTLGVVTGITLEFQFGTNWSRYSEYVGDIFGSLLAIEATLAFFLESTFLAVWHFGWNRLGKKAHLLSIWLVAIASNLSALWIILANGFMQRPVGYVINESAKRVELASFRAVLSNDYAWGMYGHTLAGSWTLAGFFVLGVSAWHLLRGGKTDFFRRSFALAAPFTLVMVFILCLTGHEQGKIVAEYQPTKFAAMESHWETAKNAPFYLLAVPDADEERNSVEAIGIPGMTSWLAYQDTDAEVKGLKDFPEKDRPPVAPVFWSFRLMVALGGLFALLAVAAVIQRGRERPCSRLLKALVWNIPLPYVCLALGWTVAEVGRQPWIVFGLMRTSDAVSPVPPGDIAISLVAFAVVYTVLGVLDIYLLRKYAVQGPEA